MQQQFIARLSEMLWLLLFACAARAAICEPRLGGVSPRAIADAERDASEWPDHQFGTHPEIPHHRPFTLFAELPTEPLVYLPQARVAIADYALLRRDFPALRSLSTKEVDDWLLRWTAWIHPGALDIARFPYENRTAPRAARWSPIAKRSLILETEAGLLELKASGCAGALAHRLPGDHSDCLSRLTDRLMEFLTEKLVEATLEHARFAQQGGLSDEQVAERTTLGHYAVIDYGFSAPQRDGQTHAAGASVRQAHARSLLPLTFLTSEEQLRAELHLRRYGFASVSRAKMSQLRARHNTSRTCHAFAVQGTPENHLADLDQVRAWDRDWSEPLCTWTEFFSRGREAMQPNDTGYIRRAVFAAPPIMTGPPIHEPFLHDALYLVLAAAHESARRFDGLIWPLVHQYRESLGLTPEASFIHCRGEGQDLCLK